MIQQQKLNSWEGVIKAFGYKDCGSSHSTNYTDKTPHIQLCFRYARGERHLMCREFMQLKNATLNKLPLF